MPEAVKTRAQWAAEISAAHDQLVDGFLKLGDMLTAAKAAMPHGTFLEMIEADLPFTARWAQKLMEIAADQRIRKASHGSLLPMAVTTVYELHRLTDDAFKQALASGEINPDMTRADAKRIVGSQVQYGERRVAVPRGSSISYDQPSVASPPRISFAETDKNGEPIAFMASGRSSRKASPAKVDEAPALKLVASARTKPADEVVSGVAPLMLPQVERVVGDLVMAVERGDVTVDQVFRERVQAVVDRLVSLVRHD